MKKIGLRGILFIILVFITVYSLFSYIFIKQENERYTKGAFFSSIEVERSLEEFEALIETENDDYTYYNHIAKGFLPSLSYHLVTSDRLVDKYEDFFWDTYYPLGDSLRRAVGNFTRVNDKESYESAKKEFKQELIKYRKAVKTLEQLDK